MQNKRIFAIGIALAMVSMALPAEADLVDDPTSSRWIVGFYGYPDFVVGEKFARGTVVEVNNALKLIVVESPFSLDGQSAVRADENVRYVEEDSTDWQLLFTPNDYFYTHAAHWGSKRIGGEAAWDVTLGSTAVKAAHLDSGLNKGHEEFAGQSRVLQGYDFHGGDNDPDDSNGCDWHGTHTTGTAGATTNIGLGIAGMSQHTILPVKIFGSGFFGCGTSTTAIVNALQYAGDQGAHLSSNSWGGGGYSSAIDDAITYAHNKGTIHVASAGNSGPCTNCVGEPWFSAGDRSIVVSSLTDGDTFSSFSSQGPQVDIIAPGEFIAGPGGGTSDYLGMSGTSMAAPHVTGALSLYLTMNPGASYNTVTNALASTAENLGFSSDRQGDGLVRADLLVGSSGGGGGGTTDPQCADGTDNDGDGLVDLNDPGCADSSDDDESDDPVTGGITLSTSGHKVKGVHHVDLSWSGASSTDMDVYRNGGQITTTANDGFYTDNTGQKGGGSYSHQVCEAGTSTCSNTATTTF